MKASAVFAAFHVVLCFATLSAAGAMLWVAVEWWRGRFRWLRGIDHLTPAVRLSYARHRSVVSIVAAGWLLAGAVGTLRFGLVISAWSAVFSVATVILVLGFNFVAAKHGVKLHNRSISGPPPAAADFRR